jgi:hypothetical protein
VLFVGEDAEGCCAHVSRVPIKPETEAAATTGWVGSNLPMARPTSMIINANLIQKLILSTLCSRKWIPSL